MSSWSRSSGRPPAPFASSSTGPEASIWRFASRSRNELRDLNENYSLEVSSPGEDRPLTKPEHFRRFLGRKVRVKTRDAIEGQRNFKGTLADADDETVTVAATGGTLVRIPFERVERSNLIGEFGFGGES